MELPTHTAPTHESGPPHSDLGDEMANRQPFKVCADTWQVSQLAAAVNTLSTTIAVPATTRH